MAFPTRRMVTQSFLGAPFVLAQLRGLARAEGARTPGADWEFARMDGFTPAGFETAEAKLVTMPTTALMVVAGGRVVYRYGDIAQVSYLASARKSILSMLYGKYVASGKINLDATIGELGIDEDDGLLPLEKSARIRDLLIASSGVYHKAGSPGDDQKRRRARGNRHALPLQQLGLQCAGAVFEKLTSKTVFAALEKIGAAARLQDFDPARQRDGVREQSRYLAYPVLVGARHGAAQSRDGARRRLEWRTDRASQIGQGKHARAPRQCDRARRTWLRYLWWIPATRTGPQWAGSFMASGQFGQYILVLPAIDVVIVHRRAVTDEFAVRRNLGKTAFTPVPVTASEFLNVADMIVAAKMA